MVTLPKQCMPWKILDMEKSELRYTNNEFQRNLGNILDKINLSLYEYKTVCDISTSRAVVLFKGRLVLTLRVKV